MRITGGYYAIRKDFVSTSLHQHTAAFQDGISDDTIEAVNLIQETGWQIDRFILDTMKEVWATGQPIGGLPSANPAPLPGRLSDDQWENMSAQEKKEYKQELVMIHSKNASDIGVREAFIRKLALAEELTEQGTFYFPHFLDFRTRVYPLPQDLHPQGDQVAKALLVFDEALPLGPDGLNWLKIKLANAAGQDKLSFEDRMRWVDRHHRDIVDSVRQPLDGYRFWASEDFDEPWVFLGTAREYVEATSLVDPSKYLSRQPVPLDGSTNGLQHLSMMGRDRVGAMKTNCSSHPNRFDLYTEVANEVQSLVSADAIKGDEKAHAWISAGIGRKTVKRAVMTTPYGVTDVGIRDQLISDGHTDGMDGAKFTNAAYLKDKIREAMHSTVESAERIMGWLQNCAYTLAQFNVPFQWTAPSGSVCVQAYYNLARSKIRTLMGEVYLWDEDKEMGLNARKQFISAAPNVIHSFDAAHMQRTVLTLNREYGLKSFAMIHDSYGVHACHTTKMSTVLRHEAYCIYREDWLTKLYEEFKSLAPEGCEIPEPPALGEYHPDEVLAAPYFFA